MAVIKTCRLLASMESKQTINFGGCSSNAWSITYMADDFLQIASRLFHL